MTPGTQPRVRLCDGLIGLAAREPSTCALVLSDLPSGETQASFDTPPDFSRFWPAVWSALAPDGVVVLMASSIRFAGTIIASQPDAFRYDLIWHKSLATGHLNASGRPLRAHEYILVFWRSKGHYEPQMSTGHGPINYAVRRAHGENYGALTKETVSRAGATDRYPRSVLDFASVGTSSKARKHPQQKPVDLLRWLVRTYSPPGTLVADPYAGSGSCGEAAAAEGRSFIGWDTDPRFGS